MTDESRETASADLPSSTAITPRQLIEDLIEIYLSQKGSSANKKRKLTASIRQLDQCIISRKNESAYMDALVRAPWLTSDVEHLKRQWQELRQSLHEVYKHARRDDGSRESLVEQFNVIAERFIECEADEQCLLEAAFPGPAWTDENLGPF